MDRVAIFVDAGYVFAQGSAALAGSKVQRVDCRLDTKAIIKILRNAAAELAPDCRLLRIYWYDAPPRLGKPTADQLALAGSDDVKLRLGSMNNAGQQKGVDSLIVTDLVELARLKSITDAVLISGDEDVRIGVTIAQNYGIRVHLVGIDPARSSQSLNLIQEADTTREWFKADVGSFLSIRNATVPKSNLSALDSHLTTPEKSEKASAVSEKITAPGVNDVLETSAQQFAASLTKVEIDQLKHYWLSEQRGIPPEYDRKLIGACGRDAGRRLSREELSLVRAQFRKAIVDLE